MKPLQELLKGKVVNCQTEEEAKEFLSFMHENGYKWCSGDTTISKTYWEVNRNNTVYYFDVAYEYISYGDKGMVDKEKYQITTYQQFKQLINENNMETKEVKIQVPEGYEIDKENSTFDCIKFKPIKKVVTYDDIIHKLNDEAIGIYTYLPRTFITSSKQSGKLLAINRLMNVARYLNGDWHPDWENSSERKYYIEYYDRCNKYSIGSLISVGNIGQVLFKSEEAANKALEILGEETIRLALSTDW